MLEGAVGIVLVILYLVFAVAVIAGTVTLIFWVLDKALD